MKLYHLFLLEANCQFTGGFFDEAPDFYIDDFAIEPLDYSDPYDYGYLDDQGNDRINARSQIDPPALNIFNFMDENGVFNSEAFRLSLVDALNNEPTENQPVRRQEFVRSRQTDQENHEQTVKKQEEKIPEPDQNQPIIKKELMRNSRVDKNIIKPVRINPVGYEPVITKPLI